MRRALQAQGGDAPVRPAWSQALPAAECCFGAKATCSIPVRGRRVKPERRHRRRSRPGSPPGRCGTGWAPGTWVRPRRTCGTHRSPRKGPLLQEGQPRTPGRKLCRRRRGRGRGDRRTPRWPGTQPPPSLGLASMCPGPTGGTRRSCPPSPGAPPVRRGRPPGTDPRTPRGRSRGTPRRRAWRPSAARTRRLCRPGGS